MNNVKTMTIYSEYIKLINTIKPKTNRDAFLGKIVDFQFYDIEPKFKKDSIEEAIWENIEKPIKKYKSKSLNGSNGGRPQNEINNKKETETKSELKSENNNKKNNETKAHQDVIVNVYVDKYNLEFIKNNNNLINKIEEWFKYKLERKDKYTETGTKSLLTRINNSVKQYGSEKVIELIDECMGNQYKGIIFDKLQNLNTNSHREKNETPGWFGKDFNKENKERFSEDEWREIDSIKNGTYKA